MGNTPQRVRTPDLNALNGHAFNLAGWIAQAMTGDMGPVGNKEVFRQSDFIFMIVKGPNKRNDFHLDPYDEIFYQLKGTIYVKYRDDDGHMQTAEVKEGEVMIITAMTPHLPIRPPETLGLVIERPRVPGKKMGSYGIAMLAANFCTNWKSTAKISKPSSKRHSTPLTKIWHGERAPTARRCCPTRHNSHRGNRWWRLNPSCPLSNSLEKRR